MTSSIAGCGRILALAALGYATLAAPARGHTGGSTGYASIEVSGNAVRYSLTLSPVGLPDHVADDLRLALAGQDVSHGRLLDLVRRHVGIRAGTAACAPASGMVTAGTGDIERATIVVDYACPAEVQELTVRDDIFDALGPDHHTLARVQTREGARPLAFAPDAREARVTLGDAGGRGQTARSFVVLGAQHILTGYDHLLFLLGLLLRGGTFLSLLKIVTAFTVAHSATLALAVLDVVVLPDRLVEAVIALSIAFVAAENLAPRPAVSRRWAVSFLFGLVHGFGFSSALRELGLPREGLALSLLGFNLGVEAGQALVIAALLPVLALLRRRQWEAPAVMGSSLAILLIALVLFVERAIFQ